MSISPKKLSIDEIWSLYEVLNPDNMSEKYFIDEILKIIKKLSNIKFLSAIYILYGKSYNKKSPIELGVLLMKGIRKNEFFSFCNMIGQISDKSI